RRFARTRGSRQPDPLSSFYLQVKAAKHLEAVGIGEIDIIEDNRTAARDQLTGAGPVDHLVVFADQLDRLGDASDKLGGVDDRKGQIARAVQDAKGDREGQNHI